MPLPHEGSPRKANYRVRFRHGVFPDTEGQATRADIKKYDYFFSAGQKWVGTEGKLDFVDESRLVAEEFESAGHVSDKRAPRQSHTSRPLRRSLEETRRTPQENQRISHTPWQLPWHIRRHTYSGPGSVSSYSSLDEPLSADSHLEAPWSHPCPSPIPVPTVAWPLSDPIEAHLFRFWIEKASENLDITSPEAVFREVVPRLALGNAMLMNAIFMTSAQNIVRIDPYFPTGPYIYHDRLLQDLIPYLAEKGRIEDEATLVAAMLLRAFEQFDAGTRGQSHLSTYELFYGPEGWLFDMSRPLVQASLMIHVHTEVFETLVNRTSLRADYTNYILPGLEEPVDDVSWGNRILWLNARVLQWMETGIQTADERQYLSNLIDEWELKRPVTFDPFFHKHSHTAFYPELWFSSPSHADANQHLRISRIALAVSRLDNSITGAHGDIIAAAIHDEVLRGLKEIVAIARCNTHCIPARWKAAHAIHRFAGLLSDETARFKMIEFLEEANAMGIPTATSIEHLVEQWNWTMHPCEWATNQFC